MQTTRLRTTRKLATFLACAGLAAALLSGCASKTPSYSKSERGKYSDPTLAPYVINNKTYYPIADATGFKEKGIASWYGDYFHGRPTSNGERYDMYGMTAAHKILPMNTVLLVKNLNNGKETTVRVNDRGPFVDGRIIDLSYTAAQKLDIVGPGTSRVEIVALPANDQNDLQLLAAAPRSPKSESQSQLVKSQVQTIKPQAQVVKPQSQIATAEPQVARSEPKLAKAAPQTAKPQPQMSIAHQHAVKPQQQVATSPTRTQREKGQWFYVQVGQYSQLENALKLKKRFTDSGHTAVIQAEGDPTQPIYQVHVFAGRELAVAKQAEAALLENGYSGASLVVR